MKKVCAALFLIILLLRPLCQSAPLGRCGDVRAAGGDFERTAGRTLSSPDDLQLGMPIFDDNRDAQV